MIRKLIIFTSIFVSIYVSSWMLWGEVLILEKGLQRFIDEEKISPIKFNKRKEFVVIPKKYGKLYPIKFSNKIPGKTLIVVQDSISGMKAYDNMPEDFSWSNFSYCGLEIDIRWYYFPFARLEYFVFGNDIHSLGRLHIWAVFGWISIRN